MGSTDAPDPFAIFHEPPPGETPGERTVREEREAAARKVSDRIDEELKVEKARLKKEKIVRVLLLGQSESGKSTTLKNFRYQYARAAWEAERLAWRSVIQLNLVRSVLIVLDAVQAQIDGVGLGNGQDDLSDSLVPYLGDDTDADNLGEPSSSASSAPQPFKHPLVLKSSQEITQQIRGLSAQQSEALLDIYAGLREQLEPLRAVEFMLMRRLGAGSTEDYGDTDPSRSAPGVLGSDDEEENDAQNHGLQVRSRSPVAALRNREWGVQRLQEALARSSLSNKIGGGRAGKGKAVASGEGEGLADEGDIDPTRVLADAKDAMLTLWKNDAVHTVLNKRDLKVEDTPGFFLNDLERIASLEYTPSDGDIVRARLRTLGVQEYRIRFDTTGLGFGGIGNDFGQEWLLYDVGGSRTMRHAWVPYFDNVQAIIFLAPVSCFDERLTENSKVNRLEDSFLLFKKICSSKLLAHATMICFLNKCDLLKRKLRSGVKVRDFLPSFGERKNETAVVVKYLREKFREVLKEHSPEQRSSYFYATSVVDTEATANTITAVKDSILQNYLKRADFL